MNETQPNNLGQAAPGRASKVEPCTNSPFRKAVCDFANFKRNLVPYTLQIALMLGVAAVWYSCIRGLFGEGELIDPPDLVPPNAEFGIACKIVCMRTVKCLLYFVAAPFVIHYGLEVAKYLFVNIVVPLWEKIVIRFLVNALPELLPFTLERYMRFIDICLAGCIAVIMTVSAVLKGLVWLPKSLCQCLDRWFKKDEK